MFEVGEVGILKSGRRRAGTQWIGQNKDCDAGKLDET